MANGTNNGLDDVRPLRFYALITRGSPRGGDTYSGNEREAGRERTSEGFVASSEMFLGSRGSRGATAHAGLLIQRPLRVRASAPGFCSLGISRWLAERIWPVPPPHAPPAIAVQKNRDRNLVPAVVIR